MITGGDGCSTTTATLLIEMRAQTVVALAQAEKSSFIYERRSARAKLLRVVFGWAEVGHGDADGGELFIDKVI